MCFYNFKKILLFPLYPSYDHWIKLFQCKCCHEFGAKILLCVFWKTTLLFACYLRLVCVVYVYLFLCMLSWSDVMCSVTDWRCCFDVKPWCILMSVQSWKERALLQQIALSVALWYLLVIQGKGRISIHLDNSLTGTLSFQWVAHEFIY